ncbi:uncharacterized protein UDID_15322 [Ustilago sp. UG-2017a]|nr:uncharacterized protein UDID_15322 [Ustilago sp. UG-2017a]
MAPSYTRIVSLLLLLAIHAVGVLSGWGPKPHYKDSHTLYIHNNMLGETSIHQALVLKENNLFYQRNDMKVNLPSDYFGQALEHAKEHGVQYIGSPEGKLYFYSIIQPDTDLGRKLGLKSKLGKHGYSSVLWEYNKENKNLDIVSVARVEPTLLSKEVPDFHWKTQPFEEVLQLVH